MPLDRDLPKREILPIPDRQYTGEIWYDGNHPGGEVPPILPITPPAGAPNVLIILIDDVGFGASSAFGGPVRTPVADELAGDGLKYTRFHTTALCSPTRAALLTGRNHHSIGMGSITELASSLPGYNSMIPNTAATIAKVLRYNGYGTAHFGKCHEIPVWETSPTGPFDRWPTFMGFEKFYGFLGGETDQYSPTLYDGTEYRPMPHEEGYHLTTDLADQAIKWVETQTSLAPEKPFLMYFAPGATHAPHQVPTNWSDEYSGEFREGWDKLRAVTFEKQKELGVIPMDALLTDSPPEIKRWDEMPEDLKPALEREMEVYAGFLAHTDYEVGRLIQKLKDLGRLDNTIVLYILGDNGASAEGTETGSFNEMINFNGNPPEAEAQNLERLKNDYQLLGTREAYNHFAVGWAHAMCTPYQWTKQIASHFGGTRNGMIVRWPAGIKPELRGNGVRNQFTHVIDVFPTLLEAIGLPEPVCVEGAQQKPVEGVSFYYTFDGAAERDRHTTQYFEMFGNRGIYNNGWTAVTKHANPWDLVGSGKVPFSEDIWELYYTYKEPGETNKRSDEAPAHPINLLKEDWTQATNLATDPDYADKLRELKDLWAIEAARYNVFPIDDRKSERIAARPPFVKGSVQRYAQGMYVPDPCVIDTFNRSFRIDVAISVPDAVNPTGALVVRGNEFGGYAFYLDREGKLAFAYNYMGLEVFHVRTAASFWSRSGSWGLRMDFTYDGGAVPGGGGTVTFRVFQGDNEHVWPVQGNNGIPYTNGYIFNTDAFLMVGLKTGSVPTPELEGDNVLNCAITSASITLTGELDPAISLKKRMFAWLAIT